MESATNITSFIAGQIENSGAYEVYIPNKINHNFTFCDNRTLKLLEEATIQLSRLNYACCSMEFYNMFTNMHVHLEALCSNEIEGTHADIKDVLSDNLGEDTNSVKIRNLYKTTHDFFNDEKLRSANIYTINMIEKINKSLMKDVKPSKYHNGKIRTEQNFIGGDNILSALFVPPPAKLVPELMQDLNDFWENEDYFIPKLIKIAIYHFQFETIHPFMDGNGRTGRLLVALQLRDSRLLSLPVLCLSNYWKRNRGRYYEALTTVRYTHNLEYWVRFFLDSIINASKERLETIEKIQHLQKEYSKLIFKSFKSPVNYIEVLNRLITDTPIIKVKDVQDWLGITYQGANKIIDNLLTLGILKEENENKRNRIFIFKEYYNLVFESER